MTKTDIFNFINTINNLAENAEKSIANTRQQNANAEKNLQNKQSSTVSDIVQHRKNQEASIKKKADETIKEAQKIYQDVLNMDAGLENADKFYRSTKKKKGSMLQGMVSEKYRNDTGSLETLAKIKTEYYILSKKYINTTKGQLPNTINYVLSPDRKNDYEELLVFCSSMAYFLKEIQGQMPEITKSQLDQIHQDCQTSLQKQEKIHKVELDNLEENIAKSWEVLADQISENLDRLLPDSLVNALQRDIAYFREVVYTVNTSNMIHNNILAQLFVDYPLDLFITDPVVYSLVSEKCSPLLVNGCLSLPISTSTNQPDPIWLVAQDGSDSSVAQQFTHGLMYSFFATCPVGSLTFSVVDPENRGGSISAFYDAKKKLPALFGDKIYQKEDEISKKMIQLNEKVEEIVQGKLGNEYSNIYEYELQHQDFIAKTEFLTIYDFPRGFDQRSLKDLQNIIKNGQRCGIYVTLTYSPLESNRTTPEFDHVLQSILGLTSVIKQEQQHLSCQTLPLAYYGMMGKEQFDSFCSKYLLVIEGLENRGIAFSPLLRSLVEAKEETEIKERLDVISEMMTNYQRDYAQVPELNTPFPPFVTVGSVEYPDDIFAESPGFSEISERFAGGKEDPTAISLPLTFDLRNSFNLLCEYQEENADFIMGFTHHIMWSFLSFMPVSKVNITVFDAKSRGNSIIPFLEFRKKVPEIFGQGIFSDPQEITEQLKGLNRRIDDFIQEKLSNKFKDILEYNLNAPSRAEAINLLMIYDFPHGLDDRTVEILKNILQNGNKCGIFVILCSNPQEKNELYGTKASDHLEQIQKHCATISFKDGRFRLMPYGLLLKMPDPLTNQQVDNFIADYEQKYEIVKKQGLSFVDILPDELFSWSTGDILKIPVGIGDGDSIVSIKLGSGSSHHGLIAGATGSGKSTLLHTLIMSSMLHYSPDELHLYLMDFKSGTEFKVYESTHLPHIQLLALDAMQDFGESILENLVAEMENRSRLFKEQGQSSLRDYVKSSGKALPRILVVMDEFQILYNDSSNRKIAMNCGELTKRLVTEGRAFGIHLLMATQSTKDIFNLSLSTGTMEQMRVRIGMKCGDSDTRYLFSDQNDRSALDMMKGPVGTAVLNLDYTEEENKGLRVVYCDKDTQNKYLNEISTKYQGTESNLKTFEGARTTKLLDYFKENQIGKSQENPPAIHIGELIKVAPPLSIALDKKRRHNMLVCGSNEKMCHKILENYTISALLHENTKVFCIDGAYLIGEEDSAPFYKVLSQQFASQLSVAETNANIISIINDVYKQYEKAKRERSTEVTVVIIKHLQYLNLIQSLFKGEFVDESEYLDHDEVEPEIEEVKAEVDPFNPFAALDNFTSSRNSESTNSGTPVGEKLIKLINDGGGYGIHFVVTSQDYQTVRETMSYMDNILSKFPERIVFALSAQDGEHLIDGVSVSDLRDNTVFFTDGIKSTFQMKPFVNPNLEELKDFLSSI